MKTIKVIIQRKKDAYFAYSDSLEGICGYGDSLGRALQLIIHAIKRLKESSPNSVPEILKGDYKIALEHL